MTDSARLLAATRAFLEAPAGCGKTHLIADALTRATKRQLVLTHTHAGVQALRRRAARLGASPKMSSIETLTAFAMRYACAYPTISGMTDPDPAGSGRFRDIFPAAERVFRSRLGKEVLCASYGGVIVDEYQDCTKGQHDAVVALAEILPCRVLGDPLQSVFNFEEDILEWHTDVQASFDAVPFDATGHRWKNAGSHDLERWVQKARVALLSGQPIDLQDSSVNWIAAGKDLSKAKRDACLAGLRRTGSVLALECIEATSHYAAQHSKGFVSLEPIDAADVRRVATQLEQSTGIGRAKVILEFAISCCTEVKSETMTYAQCLDRGDVTFSRIRKHPDVGRDLRRVTSNNGAGVVLDALRELSKLGRIYRRDRFDLMMRALRSAARGDSPSIIEGVRRARQLDSLLGRQEYRRVASYPLLVKGLEFDHAIVLDPTRMRREQLYVALTRGAQSLTVVSNSRFLKPRL